MKRGKSLLGSAFEPYERLIPEQLQQKQYSRILADLKLGPKRLKQCMLQYQRAQTNQEQDQSFKQFRREQDDYRRYRQRLRDQLDHLRNSGIQHESEYVYVRDELVEAIKQEMNIELEMNGLIQGKISRRQNLVTQLQVMEGHSTRVQNAFNDILQKTHQIKELSKSIEECLQLLKIIGVILQEQAPKLDQIERLVSQAKENVSKAERRINIAKQNQKKSTKKKCCIIFFGFLAICLILIVLYGVSVINI